MIAVTWQMRVERFRPARATQALVVLIWALRGRYGFKRLWAGPRPVRVGYCECCGDWAWLTLETAARSTATGYLCTECFMENAAETEAAWEEYRSMVGV